jgi:carboxyl-terminal processing protease
MSVGIRKRLPIALGVGLLLLGLSFGVGWAAGRLQDAQLSGYPLVNEILDLMRDHYWGDLPGGDELGRSMGRGLVQALGDPYSVLVDPPARELETNLLTGSYGGVGADLVRDSAGHLHLLPYRDGPADRAGIVEGDLLLTVDEQVLPSGMSLEEVTALLRGPSGTAVSVQVVGVGEGAVPRNIQLVRETFELPSVTSYLLPDDPATIVVRIGVFSETTSAEVDRALTSAEDRGATACVLDLRGSPGGLLEAAVDTARLFLTDGMVASEARADGTVVDFRVEQQGRWSTFPLAVAVDGGTASAAEILAGALHQRDRALLAGQPTYGKGTVQSIFPLADGSSLHLTTAVWRLPDGDSVPSGGLVPDVQLTPDPDDPDAAVRLSAERLRENEPGT